MGDQEVLTEVPAALKRLAKYVVRGFYGVEYSLALDILIRYPCVKEDDLLQLLKFDKKQLRAILNTLKLDKFIKCQMRIETLPNGKSMRCSYFYINYKLLVDVVKYRLDHVRRKIEADERDSTIRSSFQCPACLSSYTDLEVNQLFDPHTGTFHCTYCNTEVEEDTSGLAKRDASTLLARFNEQIEPIYALLRETEDLLLPFDLLEPQPTEIPELALSSSANYNSFINLKGYVEKWSDKSSTINDMYTQNVVIDGEDADSKMRVQEKPKAQPIWMSESTVNTTTTGAMECGASKYSDENVNTKDTTVEEDEVIRTLLIHERKSALAPGGSLVSKINPSESGSDPSESEGETKKKKVEVTRPENAETEQEDEEEDPTVMVAGQPHLCSEVSQHPDLVSFMTEGEREVYIRVSQQMFQSMYD
ncbi:general transcription factor IIE subunit 1-like [Latimeria chalumnae]|uniref:general transcription factor IIE subunit 1-like n=1 Tax=Latimeria chalumnae TaxID=7897 RepID=UPI0003C19217|nr:PREDICTED: general transcription factor IIE subunit 1-like [Latimeria chalumnae]|eukprot:XP_006006478.1 PREDICTED: general transcription factor IIE subunit 1-like [Latimeria chalumnae]